MVANIVSTNNIDVSKDFNVVYSMDNIIHGIPTLIVGYDIVDKLYPDFDILDIKISENIYWTFKRMENRDKFNEDLDWFVTHVYAELTKDLVYIFADPILLKKQSLVKIIRKIHSLKKIVSYIHDDMIYIYGEKLLFGVDLRLLKFLGMDVVKLKDKIKRISTDFLDDEDILIEYKNTVETLGNKVRYIPYLFSISNEQNDTTSLFHLPRKS
jgi:hypothetical protein